MNIPQTYPASLQRKLRKPATLWLGPAGIVTPVHFDSAHNLLVQIHGRKKLILVPPQQSNYLYYPALELATLITVQLMSNRRTTTLSFIQTSDALEVTLAPGEILFIPVRWWHFARAIDPTISLNFWWFSADSLRRMWHPYLIYKKSRLFARLGL
jgi:ribosomal protein L16 Arg81 hydroxylase